MLKGIHVSLLIGPMVPIPVSQEVLDALTNVQVINSTDDKMNGFELTFVLSTRSPLHTIFLLSAGSPIPLIRVVIAVVINGMTEVLMDGVMTQHEIKPGTDAAHTTLIVKGKDLTAVMDYLEFNISYPAMPAEAREVKPFHINGVGLVHGGALFTLADFAFAAAANSHEEVAVAINASISYLKGVKAGTLYAEAEEISNSRKISVYSIKIINEHNQLIATFQRMAYKKVQR